MEPILLPQGQATEAQGTFIVYPENNTKLVPPEIATVRAEKYNFALGDTSPGIDNLRTTLQNGGEKYLRLEAIANEDIRRQKVRQYIMDDLVRAKSGQPLTNEELEIISNLKQVDTRTVLDSPDTIIERLYGKKIVDTSTVLSVYSAYERYLAENPDRADAMADKTSDIVTKKEVAQKLLEEVQSEWDTAGTVSTVTNHLERFVPGFSWYNVQNALKGSGKGSFLKGSNMEGQVSSYYSMPLNEAQGALRATIDELKGANPLDAIEFLQGIIGYTRNDKYLDNAMSVADLVTPVPLSRPAMTISAGKAAADVMKDVVKIAAKVPSPRPEEVASAVGATKQAATEYLMKQSLDAQRYAAREGQQASWDDMFGKLPLLSNPKAFIEGGELAKDALYADRVARELTQTSDRLIDGVFVKPIDIARITPGTPAFESAIEEATWRVAAMHPKAVDNFMFASWSTSEDVLSGVNYANLHYGHKGGIPFQTERGANAFKTIWGMNDAEVVNVGNGFALRKQIAINEADAKTRSLLHTTTNPTPRSHINMMISWLRTPDELLSKEMVQDRAVATYGTTSIAQFGRQMVQEVKGQLTKEQLKTFETYLTKQRDFIDPKTQQRGRFDSSLAEFEKNWMKQTGAMPTEAEATAYMRFVQISNLDLVQRSIINYKNKASIGIQNVTLGKTGVKVEARITRDNPFDQPESFSFIIMDDAALDANMFTKANETWFSDSGRISRKRVLERIEKGGLVPVHLTKEGWESWKGNAEWATRLPDKQVDYVFIKAPKGESLPLNQVPDRPGGHVRLADGFMISQPELTRGVHKGLEHNYYKGDRNILHFTKQSDAKKFVAHFEDMRLLLKDGKMDELSAYIDRHLPGLTTADDFAKKLSKGGYDVNVPFMVKPMGKSLNEVENLSTRFANFRVADTNVHDATLLRKDPAYLTERGDIFPTIRYDGSPDNPTYTFGNAELVDPLETMETAFHSVINARYLDDLRINAAERFIHEFADVLDTPIAQLRAHPYKHLLEPVWKPGGDKEKINAGRNLRRTTLEFLNIQTPLERQVGYFKQKMADSIYQTIGKDGYAKLENAKNIADTWTLGATKDPVTFMRAFAFHEKLGLLNPKQYFLQAQNMATAISIEGPVRGYKAVSVYPLMRAMMINPNQEISEAMAKMGKGLSGWRKEHLEESFRAGNDAGFFKVGNEYTDADIFSSPVIIQSRVGRALDQATFFFREGERMSRMAAWNMSYLRWREANPYKVMKDADVKEILSRAAMLNGNMDRASNASWQRGVFSVPTQFWSYQVRLGELFMGKRLTGTEKARLVAGYSIMYGIPTGAAVTGAGIVWPMQEAMRKYMIENGHQYDHDHVINAFTNGLVGMTTNMVYGTETNFPTTYTPQGLDAFKDFMTGEKGAWDLAFGASGSIMYQNLEGINKLWGMIARTYGADGGHVLKVSDFSDVFSQNISTMSNLAKAWHAYKYQEWVTKNENLIVRGEVSAAQALMTSVTGLVPRTIDDAYIMAQSLKERKAAQEDIRKEAIRQLRLGFKSDNPSEAEKYFRRAQIHLEAGNFTLSELRQINKQAGSGFESMIDNLGSRFARTNETRMNDLMRRQD